MLLRGANPQPAYIKFQDSEPGRFVLEVRPLSDRLHERVLHGVLPRSLVADDRRGCTNEARQLFSVKRLQCFDRGSARRHLSH